MREIRLQILDVLETHGINYRVVGSLASMAYGEPRFTNDIDILADVRPEDAVLSEEGLEDPRRFTEIGRAHV